MKLLIVAALVAFSITAKAETAGINFETFVMPLSSVGIPVAQLLAPTTHGVAVFVNAKNEDIKADMIEVTITYEQDGKKWTRTQQAGFTTGGCWPRPCRAGVAVFVIGPVDVRTVKATVKPIVWESNEVIAE